MSRSILIFQFSNHQGYAFDISEQNLIYEWKIDITCTFINQFCILYAKVLNL